jgi:hypothetical protein
MFCVGLYLSHLVLFLFGFFFSVSILFPTYCRSFVGYFVVVVFLIVELFFSCFLFFIFFFGLLLFL